MDTDAIEIASYTDEGYKPLVAYGEWRVAVLRFDDSSLPDQIFKMERHTETDEVFILTEGKAVLVLGGIAEQLGELQAYSMQANQIYNVKRNAWHTTLLSRDAHIIIVENDNTSVENSEYQLLTDSHRRQLNAIAANLPL